MEKALISGEFFSSVFKMPAHRKVNVRCCSSKDERGKKAKEANKTDNQKDKKIVSPGLNLEIHF